MQLANSVAVACECAVESRLRVCCIVTSSDPTREEAR